MANQDAPFGFGSITRTGSEFIGTFNKYSIPSSDATIMAVGDPVKGAGSANTEGVQTVTRASAGDAVLGYIVGFEFLTRDQEDLPNLKPASIETFVFVADDPGARIVVQEDSDGGALTAASVGLNVNFVVTDANSVTGRSQVQLDSSTAAGTNTLPLKILELYQVEDNEIGNFARWVCSYNTHALKADTGSTGT